MTDQPLTSHPPDICLILRVHAEQLWLTAEVMPVLNQLEERGAIGEARLGAALAYLEIVWLDARQRASETDAALAELLAGGAERDRILYERARRYHTAVRRLRTAVGRRVAAVTCPGEQAPTHEHAGS